MEVIAYDVTGHPIHAGRTYVCVRKPHHKRMYGLVLKPAEEGNGFLDVFTERGHRLASVEHCTVVAPGHGISRKKWAVVLDMLWTAEQGRKK